VACLIVFLFSFLLISKLAASEYCMAEGEFVLVFGIDWMIGGS